MSAAVTEPRARPDDRGSGDHAADPAVAVAQLRWRLAAYRRAALHGVAECVARVGALRLRLNDPALDALLVGFRAVRDELDAMDPQGPIALDKVEALSQRLLALDGALSGYFSDIGATAGPA
jgi:hypothetical protein